MPDGARVDWVKLHVRYYADHRVEHLPNADAEVMFVRGLARAGELKLGGFIPKASVPKLARRRASASVAALVHCGLWTEVDGGYQVTNWDAWQAALNALVERRAADAARKRLARAAAKAARASADSSMDASANVHPTEKEKEEEERGTVRTSPRARAREDEPPPRCPRHLRSANPPNCGACADARRHHDEWQKADRARRAAAPRCPHHPYQAAATCPACRSEKIARSPRSA